MHVYQKKTPMFNNSVGVPCPAATTVTCTQLSSKILRILSAHLSVKAQMNWKKALQIYLK